MTYAPKHGDRVTILNHTAGRFFVEGEAVIVVPPPFALVRFDNDETSCYRYIDPDAQGCTKAELEAYVGHLNAKCSTPPTEVAE